MLPILDGSEDFRRASGHLPSIRCPICGCGCTVKRPPQSGTVRASLLRRLALADHVRNAHDRSAA
jgi:hypothetical protein